MTAKVSGEKSGKKGSKSTGGDAFAFGDSAQKLAAVFKKYEPRTRPKAKVLAAELSEKSSLTESDERKLQAEFGVQAMRAYACSLCHLSVTMVGTAVTDEGSLNQIYEMVCSQRNDNLAKGSPE